MEKVKNISVCMEANTVITNNLCKLICKVVIMCVHLNYREYAEQR